MLWYLNNNNPFPGQNSPECRISHLEMKKKFRGCMQAPPDSQSSVLSTTLPSPLFENMSKIFHTINQIYLAWVLFSELTLL